MARPRYPQSSEPLPPALPPETRTIGQLVAETIRAYGRNVYASLALGVAPAVVNVVAFEIGGWESFVFTALVGSVVFTAAYVLACNFVYGHDWRDRYSRNAFLAGVIVFLPAPFLAALFLVPAILWLAVFGLAVPAAIVERLSVADALRRARRLARVDLVHAVGSLATLALIVLLTQGVITVLLREYAELAIRIAATVASVVLWPMLLLGAALLYEDQGARLRVRQEAVDALSAEGGSPSPPL